MKTYTYLLWLWVAFIASACSNEHEPAQPTDNDYATLNISLGAITYSEAPTTDESKLTSVAFFIETPDGAFCSYFSAEAIGSTKGFERVTLDADGNITAVSLKIPGSNLNGNSTVAVVGNYNENGLAGSLRTITSLAEVQSAQTPEVTATGIAAPGITPLLSYDLRNDVDLKSGSTTNKTFLLKRIAARLDFNIEVSENGSPSTPAAAGVEFISMSVVAPKAASYLFPQTETANVTSLAQLAKYDVINAVGNTFAPCYLYETSGDEYTPLMITVAYRYNGADRLWHTLISDKSTGKCIIKRNTVYKVTIGMDVTP